MATTTGHDDEQVTEANRSGRTPVVFVHGLWLLAISWDEWRRRFEAAGYATVAPGWPDDPATVAEARQHPEAFAGKSVRQVADHYAGLIGRLDRPPAIVGHSFGGLLTQILAGRGLAAVSVAIDPAPFRGVLALPVSALRAAAPVLRNPLNYGRAVLLTEGQFRYAFANAVPEDQAEVLFKTFAVAAPGRPVFQAAAANLNPWTQARVNTKNPDRGPLLILSGEKDHTVPGAIAKGSYKRQRRNPGVTELAEVAGRGHSLTIDDGWREVADLALGFVRRFAEP